jgi:hypothetical protein
MFHIHTQCMMNQLHSQLHTLDYTRTEKLAFDLDHNTTY